MGSFRALKVSLLLVSAYCSGTNASGNAFLSNGSYIAGLYSHLDLTDAKQVFRFVFSQLDSVVIVYPTENYYYFTFTTNGKTIWGTFNLSVLDRDSGVIGFGYIERPDRFRNLESVSVGGGGDFSAKDDVFVKKGGDFTYSVTFEGKTVVFQLNDIGLAPPRKAKLLAEEVFIGPSFDESGLKFFLIFNKFQKHLYWILNEEGFVPESFTLYTEDLVVGDRTGFAFYLDKENNRKILIGAEGFNVLNNNWYDGPFDQMPDNYVYGDKIEVKKYLEASYPDTKGKIDKYGYYLDAPGSRVAVAPYFVYFSLEDLVSIIESAKSSARSKGEFYTRITQQVFDVPEDVYTTPRVPYRLPSSGK